MSTENISNSDKIQNVVADPLSIADSSLDQKEVSEQDLIAMGEPADPLEKAKFYKKLNAVLL
jgi:hypothetical protein